MSDDQHENYRLDHGRVVTEQIRAIAAYAKKVRKSQELKRILKKAVHLLETDPHSWGDPVYHAKSINGVVYHSIIRPLAFRYVVFDEVGGVVLLAVRLYTDFD